MLEGRRTLKGFYSRLIHSQVQLNRYLPLTPFTLMGAEAEEVESPRRLSSTHFKCAAVSNRLVLPSFTLASAEDRAFEAQPHRTTLLSREAQHLTGLSSVHDVGFEPTASMV